MCAALLRAGVGGSLLAFGLWSVALLEDQAARENCHVDSGLGAISGTAIFLRSCLSARLQRARLEFKWGCLHTGEKRIVYHVGFADKARVVICIRNSGIVVS